MVLLERAVRSALAGALGVLVFAGVWTTACGSGGRAVDPCRDLEEARCEQAEACSFEGFRGTAASCARFYVVQCGRGVQDSVREPTEAELSRCLAAIRGSCDVAREPTTAAECSFLLEQRPEPVPDAGADLAPDAAASGDGAPNGG